VSLFKGKKHIPEGDKRGHYMSILFRTKGWLTLAQLLPTWASELAEAKKDANQIERDLRHFLIEDIINDRLDDAGPLKDGRRLGLRLITPENQAAYLEGHQARDLLTAVNIPAAFSFVSNRLVVMKEAVLDFARRHELPPPSWWTDASTATKEQTGDLPVPEQPAAGEKPNNSAAEQEARAANERSRALKQEMTARLFADLFWPVSRALGWIAFRDEARIEDTLRAATWYSVQAARPLRDANPQGTLLRALQDGGLRDSGTANTCRAKRGPMRGGGVGRMMFVFVARLAGTLARRAPTALGGSGRR
jgi:hypothetical protein